MYFFSKKFCNNKTTHYYSYSPNNSTGHDKRTGYLIGFFGYNIKNYCLFNKFFWKFRQKNKRTCAIIRGIRVAYIIDILNFVKISFQNLCRWQHDPIIFNWNQQRSHNSGESRNEWWSDEIFLVKSLKKLNLKENITKF